MIRSVLGVIHNAKLDKYFPENLDTIQRLHDVILKINEKYPISGFVKADTEITTLMNYFQKMEGVVSKPEFQYVKDELMHYLKRIIDMLEMLKIWSWKEYIKDERYYDDLKGEFKQGIWEDADKMMEGLHELESYALSHKEDTKMGDAFIKLLSDVEKVDEKFSGCFGEERRKLIIALSDTYDKLEENPIFSQAYGDTWKFCKIRLFRLRRNVGI